MDNYNNNAPENNSPRDYSSLRLILLSVCTTLVLIGGIIAVIFFVNRDQGDEFSQEELQFFPNMTTGSRLSSSVKTPQESQESVGADGTEGVGVDSSTESIDTSKAANLAQERAVVTHTQVVTAVATQTASAVPEESLYFSEPDGRTLSTARGTGEDICDGRYLLIYYSVIDQGQNLQAEIDKTLREYPGAQVYASGACPSLRAKDESGRTAYAIARNYGQNVGAACTAQASYPRSNVRALKRVQDYTDPCK